MKIYFTISGYIEVDANSGEEACDKVEALPLAKVLEEATYVEIECEY